mgnify:CR=1 FL=1
MMIRIQRKSAQSTIAYVLVLSAIILGILVGTTRIKKATSKGLDDAAGAMENATAKFKQSIVQ